MAHSPPIPHKGATPASKQKDSLSECFDQEVGGGDVAATVLQMLYHVREANAVFLTKVMIF